MFSFNLFILLLLPLLVILYWRISKKSIRYQNELLLAASYYFYCCWDWRFLFILVFSTLLDYYTGKKIAIATTSALKRRWLSISIVVNLGILFVLKYYNFFAGELLSFLKITHLGGASILTDFILPIGISFYTFHGLSYILDIYNEKRKPAAGIVSYSLFVSFFPLLLAGPIERATHLLPQLESPRIFRQEEAITGMRQILWGLFMKLVIADNCSTYANLIFNESYRYDQLSLIIGVIIFSFQIYCDFSGYSNIASGTSKLFGIRVIQNFKTPYFATSITDFWRRWHISLSTWFRDYVFIPLGGSRVAGTRLAVNILITFLLSGLWHGANWTFLCWGGLNAFYILAEKYIQKSRILHHTFWNNYLLHIPRILLTFILISAGWVFFRAETLTHAMAIFAVIFNSPDKILQTATIPFHLYLLLLVFITIEWYGRNKEYTLEHILIKAPLVLRWGIYYGLVLTIILYSKKSEPFIYFNF